MLAVPGASSWAGAEHCFGSTPAKDAGRTEAWFSSNHTHDVGAVAHGFKHIVPVWGLHANELVTTSSRVADERGVLFITVDPSKYEGTEPLPISVIQQQWVLEKYWVSFLLLNTSASLATFVYAMRKAANAAGGDAAAEGKAKELALTVLELSDIYKDALFVLYFPHSGPWVTFFLSLSLCAPMTMLWIRHNDLRIAGLYLLGIQNLFPAYIDQKMKTDMVTLREVF